MKLGTIKVILIYLSFTMIFLSTCSKDEKECSDYREVEWYVNDSLQGLAGITDPWYGLDMSNFWHVEVAGYWQLDYSSPDYTMVLENRKAMFTKEELEDMDKEEWKEVVVERCVWDSLNHLRFCFFIIYKDGEQVETKYKSGSAYFNVMEKESCDFLEVNTEAVFIDTTENKDYHISARGTFEYDYRGGEHYWGSW